MTPLSLHEDLPSLLIRRWPERRAVILAAASVLFGTIFAARLGDGTAADHGLALLYVVPVALVALELGIAGGLSAALLAAALTVPGLGALGIATRATVFLAVGLVAGRFADRMRGAQERQSLLLRSGLELSRLAEDADVAAAMTAALTRLPHVAAATVTLRDGTTAAAGERAHGRVALTAPIEARGTRLGTAELTLRRAPSLEQHAALAAVLVQAGVAAENRLLLERERERAVLQAELIMARHLAEEQRRGLAAALDRQERQRRDVAVELHEETAQALAAVLLQLRVLQRRDDQEPELEQLRSAVHDTVVELRRIATELRPPTLDQLGLGPALVNLAAAEQEARGAAVTVRTTDLDERLDGEHETAVFRIVEEAMHALSGPLSVVAGRDAHLLRIEVRARGQHRDGAVDARGLELLRARTELLGGAIETGADRVTVTLPAAA